MLVAISVSLLICLHVYSYDGFYTVFIQVSHHSVRSTAAELSQSLMGLIN